MNPRYQRLIAGPREMHRVDSAEGYATWAVVARSDLGFDPPALKKGQRLNAFINEGRWLVQCPCGNGAGASHEWGVAICVECGAVHGAVFPRDRHLVEQVLLARPDQATRNYYPDAAMAAHVGLAAPERLAHLILENREHGLPKRPNRAGWAEEDAERARLEAAAAEHLRSLRVQS